MRKRGKGRRAALSACLTALTLLTALGCLGAEAERVLPGVSVAGVDLGGLTRQEAEALLEERDYGGTTVELWDGGVLLASLTCDELGARPDCAAAAEAACLAGREEGGPLSLLRRGWRRLFPADTVEVALPFTLDEARLAAALPAAPADAAYDPATGEIREGRPGIRVDGEALCRALEGAEPGGRVALPAALVPPEISAAQLREALFRDLLGEYRTEVGGSPGRRGNVALSAAAIQDTVLLPGEVFDYNAALGQRTRERGYAPAPAYVNGETVEEVGGGICQTSSTLYAAALLADLEIVERSAHRYASSYIPLGLDATVSWGGPEFRFRNDTRYPLKIQAGVTGETLTVSIYGTRLDASLVQVRSEILATDPAATRYQDTAALPLGTERTQQDGSAGCTVQTYREVYDADGNLLRSSAEARSVYRRRDKIILRGTAAPPPEPNVSPPETAEENRDPMLDAPF